MSRVGICKQSFQNQLISLSLIFTPPILPYERRNLSPAVIKRTKSDDFILPLSGGVRVGNIEI